MIESLQRIFDEAKRLIGVDLARFEGDRQFITAICSRFELLTAVCRAIPETDGLEMTISSLLLDEEEEIVSASELRPWADLIGGNVSCAWQLTNHQGYVDGVRFEFRKADARQIVEIIVAAAAIHISTVAGDF